MLAKMETSAEENYLKAIYTLSESTSSPVPTTHLSKYIKSKPSSVTDMLQRLALKKLVDYQKYKGVSLTKRGHNKALLVIRSHRLWEVFLVEKLGFSWDQVHDLAERLEHVNHEELVNRLDGFLNYPIRDPHGDLIPDENGQFRDEKAIPLQYAEINKKYSVTAVKDSSNDFLRFLDHLKIGIGTSLKVKEMVSYDGSVQVNIEHRGTLYLSDKTANNLLVKAISR